MARAERVLGGDSVSREGSKGRGRESCCGAGRVQPIQSAGGDGGLCRGVQGAGRRDRRLQSTGAGNDERKVRLQIARSSCHFR